MHRTGSGRTNDATETEVTHTAGTGTDRSVRSVTPLNRDVTYDHRARQAALPVRATFEDGTTAESVLVLDPDEMERVSIQLIQALDKRSKAKAKEAGL